MDSFILLLQFSFFIFTYYVFLFRMSMFFVESIDFIHLLSVAFNAVLLTASVNTSYLLLEKLDDSSAWINLFQINFSFFPSSAFTLMCGFGQAFWLNLITLCIFCNSNLYDVWLVWKFLYAQRIHFCHGKYAQVIQMSCLQGTTVQTFQILFFPIKVVNNFVFCVIVQDIQHQLYKYPTSLSLLSLY